MTSQLFAATRGAVVTQRVAIVASVLPADYSRLDREMEALEDAGVDRVQWDVMDGRFVPNLTFGPDVIAAARPHCRVPFEAHLMVDDPDLLLVPCVEAGCQLVIVHAEACRHLHRTLMAVREAGAKVGVALNPATPLEAVRHVLNLVDLLLVMTVNPGFGGQSYLASMEPKITDAAAMIKASGRSIEIEVDGGIGPATAASAVTAGARALVAGSALYRDSGGLAQAVTTLRRRGEEALA
jgi:ribulose-phosphate 3-epimerase